MNKFNSAIIFKNSACKCSIVPKYGPLNVKPENSFVLSPDDARDDYTYVLNLKEHAELVRKQLYRNYSKTDPKTNGIISQILSLVNKKSPDAYIAFFKRNGFFFPLDTVNHTEIDESAVIHLCNRIFAIYELRKHLQAEANTYEMVCKKNQHILELIIYLLYSKPITLPPYLRNPELKIDYIQPIEFTRLLYDANFEYPSAPVQAVHDTKYFTVPDAIYKLDKIDAKFYNQIYSAFSVSEMANSDYPHYRQLVAMHCSPEIKGNTKVIVDFFYHYQKENGIIAPIIFNDYPFADYPFPVAGKLSTKLATVLPDIAKIIICEEINYYISTARPFLNHETQEINWKVDSLLQAIYLGIMHDYIADYLYRKCNKPDCEHPYYPSKSTVTKKLHCCPSCSKVKNTRNTRARAKGNISI